MGRIHLILLVSCLLLAGFGIAAYKWLVLGYPLMPDATDDVWVVESHLSFYASGGPAKVSAFIPDQSPVYVLEDESFVSQGFGLSTLKEGRNRMAVWAIRRISGVVDLYYRVVIRESPSMVAGGGYHVSEVGKTPKVDSVDWTGMEKDAAENSLRVISEASADRDTLVRQLFRRLSQPLPRSSEWHLLGPAPKALKRAVVARKLLGLAGIPARVVQGISLKESAATVDLIPYVEVFYDNHWHLFKPSSGEKTSWKLFLPWYRGERDLVELSGGSRLRSVTSVQRLQEEAVSGALHLSKKSHPFLSAFSLYGLPVEVQSVYRVLLMIPVGAFLVVLLRNLVGLKTLGTFMPVLIALSFRESDPIWGGVLFSGIVAFALVFRAYFEHLRLLLVPRLASILTVIVVLMLLASLLLNSLGVERGLSVALFPMVILTMVVERMSILWDELGPRSAIRQGLFTLFVSLVIFYVIEVRAISHLLFVFPELLLVLLVGNLLLGRYTGYRLVELYRFRSLMKGGQNVG